MTGFPANFLYCGIFWLDDFAKQQTAIYNSSAFRNKTKKKLELKDSTYEH